MKITPLSLPVDGTKLTKGMKYSVARRCIELRKEEIRGLEWQIASPPPPGNFARIPVVLSGPYEYGTPGAPPVADLNPPVGAVTAAYAPELTPAGTAGAAGAQP